jgi:acetyltransferase-like isoleucine patch superfamily enzyme|tara:strand:- start:911 stop:1381 length:471 start_codon:yes stop_codon:yes gene_type:complete
MDKAEFKQLFLEMIGNQDNPFHPLVWINGDPEIGPGTYIGGFSDINATKGRIVIGAQCDIASFVAINAGDTHLMMVGLAEKPEAGDIEIGDYVFIGSHSVIMGGVQIGHHSVVGAGTIVRPVEIPPYSLVVGNPMVIKSGYYNKKAQSGNSREEKT